MLYLLVMVLPLLLPFPSLTPSNPVHVPSDSSTPALKHTHATMLHPLHQQNMLMLQRPGRPGSTQEGWEQNSTFRSSLNTPGACQEWLGIVWRVCASSCQELKVPGRVRSNWPLQHQIQGS